MLTRSGRRPVVFVVAAGLISLTATGESLGAQAPVVRLAQAWSRDAHDAEVLFRPTTVVVTPGCHVWLPDVGNARIYRWDCNGRALPALGRKGDGPGEFNGPTVAAMLRGDTVGVWDRPLQRLSLYAADGRLIGTRRMAVSGAEHGFVRGFALNYPETLVSTEVHPAAQPRPLDGSSVVWAVDGEGRVTRTLIRLSGPPPLVDRSGAAPMTLDPPFAEHPRVLFSPRGFVLVATSPEGTFTRYRYGSRLAEDGRLRLDLPQRRVTRAERNRWRDSMQAVFAADLERASPDLAARRTMQARFDGLLAEARFPTMHPAYDLAVLDEQDQLWLKLTGTSVGLVRWNVYNARSGALRRVVEFRTRDRILSARPFRGAVFTVEQNADGLPRLVRYVPTREP